MALKDIIEKIISDAEMQAQAIKTESNSEVSKIEAQGEKEILELDKEMHAKLDAEKTQVIEHDNLTVKMNARKQNLAMRSEIIEETLDAVVAGLDSLKGAEYTDFIKNILTEVQQDISEATVIPAKGKEKETKAALKDFKNFTLSKTAGKFSGGAIFQSANSEIDASTQNLVKNNFKEDIELFISKELFS